MDNQHKKIKGYRDLSQDEIDLMNRIKEKGQELLALQAELEHKLGLDLAQKEKAVKIRVVAETNEELERFLTAEPLRWARIGKTDIQTGIMALVRAVAQPTSC